MACRYVRHVDRWFLVENTVFLAFFLISFNFYTPVSLIFFPSTRVSPVFPFCLRPSFFALCTFVFIYPRSIYFALFLYFLSIFIIPLSCRILLSCSCRYRSQYPLRITITFHAFLLVLFLVFLGKSHSRLDVFSICIFNSMDRVSLYNIFAALSSFFACIIIRSFYARLVFQCFLKVFASFNYSFASVASASSMPAHSSL